MNKKIVSVFVLVILVAGISMIFLYFVKIWAPDKLTRSTDLSREAIGGFRVHDSINSPKFREKQGKPLSRENNDLYDYYHWGNRMETASVISGRTKGEIMRFIIEGTIGKDGAYIDPFDNPLRTRKGIRLGDSEKKVIHLYGKRNYHFFDDGSGAAVIGYVDHLNGIKLEFELSYQDHRVEEILLEDVRVE